MRKRLVAVIAALLTAATLVAPVGVSARSAFENAVPYQYMAKMFSEILGRAPQPAEWTSTVEYFEERGCTASALAGFGLDVFGSEEFAALDYSHAGQALVLYRAVLNREADEIGLAAAIAQPAAGSSVVDMARGMYGGPEFQALMPQICNPVTPDYDFGMAPAIDVPVDGEGYVGDQMGLQAALDAAEPGTTVFLAPRAVVRLLTPLYIPQGVELATTGRPGPRRYAEMGRVVRAPVWPTFADAAVIVEPGAKLRHVWVDGQQGSPARHQAASPNVRVLSGRESTVSFTRLGNTVGNTALSSLGRHGHTPCIDNDFSHNFIEAYSSSHFGGTWADGISIGCEDATVAYNEVVDTTDVSIITFAQPQAAQVSQVYGNVVLNAGQGAFAQLSASPFIGEKGDGPGYASMDFTGSVFRDNVIWNTPRSANESGILVGVRAASGIRSLNGKGQVMYGNTSGGLRTWVQNGIIVSGMLDVRVVDNDLDVVLVDDACTCPPAEVGAAVSSGYASGEIQGPYVDGPFTACVTQPTGLM